MEITTEVAKAVKRMLSPEAHKILAEGYVASRNGYFSIVWQSEDPSNDHTYSALIALGLLTTLRQEPDNRRDYYWTRLGLVIAKNCIPETDEAVVVRQLGPFPPLSPPPF